jgi:hypothetical protein
MRNDEMLLQPRAILRAAINRICRISGADPLDQDSTVRSELKQAGQIVVIFALMLTVLIGLVGIAIDTTYAWREELLVQRAADAASLAGVVYMPGNFNGASPSATSTAIAEAGMNGFPNSSNTISVKKVDLNPYELDVSITTQIPTFFSRIFGINTFTVTRLSKAVYVLPVPMGSPENYYGSFGQYKMCTSSSSCDTSDTTVTLTGPSNEPMTARGFWGSELTQGAAFQNGDAYLPKFNVPGTPPTGTNPQQDTTNYYDYAVYMPPGTSAGHVWIFDPGFCATDGRHGTGDRWFEGTNAVSVWYKLYNTNNSPYNLAAQTFLGSSGSFFANMKSADSLAGGSPSGSVTECKTGTTSSTSDPRYYHNKWWDLTAYIGTTLSGGTGGTTYRIRTTTDPGDTSQDSTDATNDFAIFASATGGSPQVYGIGSIQMYTPLTKNTSSTFYMAQISQQAGAGKTVEINLWDPGDTNSVPATMKVLQPTTSGWSAASMTWTANRLASTGSNCVGGSGSSIQTNNGGTSFFNGCWVHISIVVPITYTAPQSGWWKIEYDMGNCTGSGSACYSTDETTWQVDIRGNPVHLI